MAIPKLPWYGKLRDIVAPSEPVMNFSILIIIAISIAVLMKGDAASKAFWVVYVVSP